MRVIAALFIAACWASVSVASAPTCWTYHAYFTSFGSTFTGNGGSPSAACSDVAAKVNAASYAPYHDYSASATVTGGDASSGYSFTCAGNRMEPGTVSTDKTSGECPPNPCDQYNGKQLTQFQEFSEIPDMGVMVSVASFGGCSAQRTSASSCTANPGGYFCGVTYDFKGASDPSALPPPGTNGDCALINGKLNCAVQRDDDGNSCAVIGGEKMCFEGDINDDGSGPPDAGCWHTPEGGLLCKSDAVVKSSAGDVVAPDSVTEGTTNTYNYYSASTVSTNHITNVASASPGSDPTADPTKFPTAKDIAKAIMGDTTSLTGDITDDAVVGSSTINVGDISETGVFATGNECPSAPDIVVFGQHIAFAPFTWMCNFADAIGGIVLLAAYLAATYISIGSVTRG